MRRRGRGRALHRVGTVLTVVALCLAVEPRRAAAEEPPEIMVYAAASLRDVLQEIAPACEKANAIRLVFDFGASSDLSRQIQAADKADLFLSADETWMDALARAGLVDASSRRTFLSNRLVVVGPLDTRLRVGAASDLSGGRVRWLSLANPDTVPAGKYARSWLERTGQWEAVKGRIMPALDVRAALAAVESGGADAGIVYRTDARTSKHVVVLYEVPEAEGPPISYSVAALLDRPHLEAARRVAGWLASRETARIFESHGFIVPQRRPADIGAP
jgi:molybdate transport system substrate-binding protein